MGTHPIFESDFDCLTDYEMYALRCLAVIGCVQGLLEDTSKDTSKDHPELIHPELGRSKRWVSQSNQRFTDWQCVYKGQIYEEGSHKDYTRCQRIECYCNRHGICSLSFAQLGARCYYDLPEGCIAVEDKCGLNPTFVMERNRRISCKPYGMGCNGK